MNETQQIYKFLLENIKSRYKAVKDIETSGDYKQIFKKDELKLNNVIWTENSIKISGIRDSDIAKLPTVKSKEIKIIKGRLYYKQEEIRTEEDVRDIYRRDLIGMDLEESNKIKLDIKNYFIYKKEKKTEVEMRTLIESLYKINVELENSSEKELVNFIGKIKLGDINLPIFIQNVSVIKERDNYVIDIDEYKYKFNQELISLLTIRDKSLFQSMVNIDMTIEEVDDKIKQIKLLLLQEYSKDDFFVDEKYNAVYVRATNKLYLIDDYEKIIELYDEINEEEQSLFKIEDSYKINEQKIQLEESKVLFPLPYNEEQYKILKVLENSNGVVVQGPPGTGKSHTISNIVSHYMANGKKVLVTSEKPEALKVVIDKIPKEIQSLVIPLLSNNSEDKRKTEVGIGKIEEAIATFDEEVVNNKEIQLKSKLKDIRLAIKDIRAKIIKDRKMENELYSIYGEEKSLIQWAEKLDGFSPEFTVSNEKIPIDIKEYNILKEVLKKLKKLDYVDDVIAPEKLIPLKEYERFINLIKENTENRNLRKEFEQYNGYLENSLLKYNQNVQIEVMNFKLMEDLIKEPIENIKNVFVEKIKNYDEIKVKKYKIEFEIPKINDILKSKSDVIVENYKVISKDELGIINKRFKLKKIMEEFKEYNSYFEENLEEFHKFLKNICEYNKLNQEEKRISEYFSRYNDSIENIDKNLKMFEWIKPFLKDERLESAKDVQMRIMKIDNMIFMERLQLILSDIPLNTKVKIYHYEDIDKINLSYTEYEKKYEENKKLYLKNQVLDKLRSILDKITDDEKYFIQNKINTLAYNEFVQEWKKTYIWSVINELVPNDSLMRDLYRSKTEERELLKDLVVNSTWLTQIKKIDVDMKSKISEWSLLNSKMGKGTGKKDKERIKKIRDLLTDVQEAIPVWISPINQVITNFPFDIEKKFDLIIIDESSQSSLEQVVLLNRANKVLIVGDDKQISPVAAFRNHEEYRDGLNRYFPYEKPNFLDQDTTLFDYGKRTFNMVMLKELTWSSKSGRY